MRNMSSAIKTLSSTAGRTKKILKAFMKSKRAIIGLAIIVFFVVLAAFAPLLTPYDPTGDNYLAGNGEFTARPIWFRYLPFGSDLSENMQPIVDPEFASFDPRQNWNITSSSDFLSAMHSSATGQNGSLAIVYDRSRMNTANICKIQVSQTIHYPYGGAPARFNSSVQLMIESATDLPIKPMLFLENVSNQSRYDWGFGSTQDPKQNWAVVGWVDMNLSGTTTKWVTPAIAVTSDGPVQTRRYRFTAEVELAGYMMPNEGDYVYGLELTFYDSPTYAGNDVRASVYIDNLDFRLYGKAFGLLGCDFQGRDIFTQLVYGTRVSIYVGILSAVISVALGLVVGLVAAYMGGIIDEVTMRLTDAILVLPGLPLLIVLIAVLGTSVSNLIIIIGFLGWMGFARVVRSQVLSLKERPFVESAKAIGAGRAHIIFKHIVPNVMSLVYVTLATSVPGAIVAEAALSYLGFFDPSLMSWGRMLNDVQTHSGYKAYWWVVPPGLCIAAISVAFILLGYALDEILNPRLRMRR